MEIKEAAATPQKTVTGLDSVRARAKRQGKVRFTRALGCESNASSSLQKIRTLKSISAEAEECLESQTETAPLGILSKLWGAFQTAIGNR